jgi:YD repeat-containing protein
VVQTKAESSPSAQNIITDMRYDALGRVVAQSQPRYVNETSATTFWVYTDPGATLTNPTSTSYDALGRPIRVTSPDGTWSEHLYGVSGNLTYPTPSTPIAIGPRPAPTRSGGSCRP